MGTPARVASLKDPFMKGPGSALLDRVPSGKMTSEKPRFRYSTPCFMVSKDARGSFLRMKMLRILAIQGP